MNRLIVGTSRGLAPSCRSRAFVFQPSHVARRTISQALGSELPGHDNTLPTTVTVTFIDPNRGEPWRRQTVQAPVGASVVDVAKAYGIDIHAACGQKLQCATCHVILPSSHYNTLQPPGVREGDLLESTFTLSETSRLGCQVKLTQDLDGVEITLPDARAKGSVRLTLEQPRPRVERHWTATPASMPSFRRDAEEAASAVPSSNHSGSPLAGRLPASGAGRVVAGITGLAPNRASAELTDVSRLVRELEDERSLTARLESELRQIRTRSLRGTGKVKEADVEGGPEGEDEEGLAKLKAELKQTKVDISRMGRRVGFRDVIGLEEAKQALAEAIVWPVVADPALFRGVRGGPRGLLLYGPPGCGKTMLARAAAAELGARASFFHVHPGDVMSKFYGESQRRVKALQELVQEHAPAVVFFDEVDSLLGSRDGGGVAEHHRATTNALLAWMDGFATGDERVFFLGATNRAEAIDEAALRRFGDAVEVGKPCERARLALLKHLVFERAMPDGHRSELGEACLTRVVESTDGFSLADLHGLVRRAFMEVLRQLPGGISPGLAPMDVPPVTLAHFEAALATSSGTTALREMFRKRAEKRAKM